MKGYLVKCVRCGHDVSTRAKRCPNPDCGEERFNPNLYVPSGKCINCGADVFPDDKSCRKCGELEYYGVVCDLCRGHVRKNDAWTRTKRSWELRAYNFDKDRTFYYHFSCIERYFTPPIQLCEVCHDPLPIDLPTLLARDFHGVGPVSGANPAENVKVERKPVCARCGHPISFPEREYHDCRTCGLPIYLFQNASGKRAENSSHLNQHYFCDYSYGSKPVNTGCLSTIIAASIAIVGICCLLCARQFGYLL